MKQVELNQENLIKAQQRIKELERRIQCYKGLHDECVGHMMAMHWAFNTGEMNKYIKDFEAKWLDFENDKEARIKELQQEGQDMFNHTQYLEARIKELQVDNELLNNRVAELTIGYNDKLKDTVSLSDIIEEKEARIKELEADNKKLRDERNFYTGL